MVCSVVDDVRSVADAARRRNTGHIKTQPVAFMATPPFRPDTMVIMAITDIIGEAEMEGPGGLEAEEGAVAAAAAAEEEEGVAVVEVAEEAVEAVN